MREETLLLTSSARPIGENLLRCQPSIQELVSAGLGQVEAMRLEDESPATSFSLLRIHQLDTRTLASAGRPSLAALDSTMTPAHRQAPNDVMRQRRLRGGPSLLTADPSNRNVATLMLS